MQASRDNLREQYHRGAPAHAGLLLARYLRDACEDSEEFRQARQDLHDAAQKAVGHVRPYYERAFHRWQEWLPEPQTGDWFTVQGRLVVGLGGEHVLETGLTLHHTYGTPLLPGTGLKGLAAHFCDQVWGAADPGFLKEGDYHRVLFGKTDEGGLVHFHDAWIEPASLGRHDAGLLSDVLTPHHSEYYGGRTALPTDFDDPNPVSFLSVAGRFYVSVSCTCSVEPEKWAGLGFELLTQALAQWGVGGKTSSGYGRLLRARQDRAPGAQSKGEVGTHPAKPRYKTRDVLTVRRGEDPKGKGRSWFLADDGFGGVIVAGTPPQVAVGETIILQVQAVMATGYNFRMPSASSGGKGP